MDVHLIDGTYELFRHFFAVPFTADSNGQEVGEVRGVLTSVLSMIEHGATHIGVATDHVVESFRNDLYPGYKASEGVPPELLSQFPILEEALEAMGVQIHRSASPDQACNTRRDPVETKSPAWRVQ
jgi:5'-3' exonuclease